MSKYELHSIIGNIFPFKDAWNANTAFDLRLAMQVARYFRLADQKASRIIDHAKKSITEWRLLAEKHKSQK